VLLGRYHLRILRTPREVRRALVYVLLDARKRWWQRHQARPPVRLDEARLVTSNRYGCEISRAPQELHVIADHSG
jgi:hypothetical protein